MSTFDMTADTFDTSLDRSDDTSAVLGDGCTAAVEVWTVVCGVGCVWPCSRQHRLGWVGACVTPFWKGALSQSHRCQVSSVTSVSRIHHASKQGT